MRIAVLGATKGIGRAIARRLAERGDRLFLLGRDLADLERSARDLSVRGGVRGSVRSGGRGSVRSGGRGSVRAGVRGAVLGSAGEGPGEPSSSAPEIAVAHCDLERPETFGPALDAAADALGGLDAVVVTAADFAPQEALEADRERMHRLLAVDFTGTVLFCDEARRRLLAARAAGGAGILCVLSSVAGERGRTPVVVYGAAKAGLTAYLEGLDHRHHREGLTVITVKPGFVKTSMTQGIDPPPFAGEPDGVARDIVRAIDRRRPVVYTPWPWRWVMLLIRHLPRAVMRRVGF